MRLRHLLGLCLLTAVSCQSGSDVRTTPNHWNVDSVGPRIFRHLTGYRPDLHGDFPSYQYGKKKDINLTLRRHFLNNNPRNPLQAEDPSQVEARRNASILPDVPNYFHVESLALGGTLLAWSGAFVPIPLESILASIMVPTEFGGGVSDTFKGKWSSRQFKVPSPSEFTVQNR